MQEIDASESAADQPVKVQIYGETGTGKTFSLKTLPAVALPAALFDIDLGSSALHENFEPGKMRIFRPQRTSGDMGGRTEPLAYKEIAEELNKLNKEGTVKTIVIDSMTMLYSAILDHVVYKGKTKNIESAPTLQEYGIAMRLTLKMIEALISMNVNVILICHESAIENEISGIIKGVPALTGKLGSIVPRYFDEIYHSKTEGSGTSLKYVWDTAPKGLYIARSRKEMPATIPQDWGQLFT